MAALCDRQTNEQPVPTNSDELAAEWLRAKGFFDGVPAYLSSADALASAMQARVGSRRCTPLMAACDDGELWLCEWLFDHGAADDVRTVDNNVRTPLFVACEGGHLLVCRWLFDHGAVEDVGKEDDFGWTPLGGACYRYHSAVQRWLLQVGGGALLDNDWVRDFLDPSDQADLVAWIRHELALHDDVLPLVLWGMMRQRSGCKHLWFMGGGGVNAAARRVVFGFVGVEVRRAVLVNLRSSLAGLQAMG